MNNSFWTLLFITLLLPLVVSCGGSKEKTAATSQAPTIHVSAPNSAVSGELVYISANVSDPNNLATTIEWTLIKGSGITLSATTTNNISFSIPLTTTTTLLELQAKATNSDGLSAHKAFTIDVPATTITLVSEDSFQVLKSATLTAEIQNINLSAFTGGWSLNNEVFHSKLTNAITYQPKFSEQGETLSFGLNIDGDGGQQLAAKFDQTVPEVSVNFNVPYEPIALRYVHVNAEFENIDPNDIELKWEIINNEELMLEKTSSASLQFFASEPLITGHSQYFRGEQHIELSLTLAHAGENIDVHYTSLTIKDIEQLPLWSKHSISQSSANRLSGNVSNKKSKLNSQNPLDCINDNNFSVSKIKTIDFNQDGFDDYFCLYDGVDKSEIRYHQSIAINSFEPEVVLLSNTDSEAVVFNSIQFFDLNNNSYPEIFVPQKLALNTDDAIASYYYQFEQLEFDSLTKLIERKVVFPSTAFTSAWYISFEHIENNFYFIFNFENKLLSPHTIHYPIELNRLNIVNGEPTTPEKIVTDVCDIGCRNISLEKHDINGDGQNELLFRFTEEHWASPSFETLYISTNVGQSFHVGITCRVLYKKNIDDNEHIEWVCGKGGWWEVTQEYLITLVDNEVQLDLIIDHNANIFKNHIFYSCNQDINNDQIEDSITYSTLYHLETFDEYLEGSYIFYELADTNQRILLTRYSPYFPRTHDGIICYHCETGFEPLTKLELLDMDNDGDLDIKVEDEYWLENIESLPITETAIE